MNVSSTHPNFFIVGAPRCGTTSLARYLTGHPEIFITSPKEPNYFARTLNTPFENRRCQAHTVDLKSYLALYGKARPEQCWRGDASTRYLRCEAALREIRSLYPEARLIVMVREPAAMAQSWHAQKLWERQEIEPDMEQAWHLEESRHQGQNLPPRLKATDALFYSEVASLGTQIERLLTIFPRDQVQLNLFDDLLRNPRAVYQQTLQFLGLPDNGRKDFIVHNSRRKPTLANRLLTTVGLSTPRAASGQIAAGFVNELRRHFQPEVEKLRRFLNRDLAEWKS